MHPFLQNWNPLLQNYQQMQPSSAACRAARHGTHSLSSSFGCQLRVCLHAFKALSARAMLELKFLREKILKNAGIFEPAQSIKVAPQKLRNIRPQAHTLCDGGFSKAMKALFSPSTQAAECAIPAAHPTLCATSTYDLSVPKAQFRN